MSRLLQKGLVLGCVLWLAAWSASAQAPYISRVDVDFTTVEDIVFISGRNFSPIATQNAVYFGAVRGQVLYTSTNLLEVRVPAGTTYSNISVTNLSTGLTGYDRDFFFLSYGGAPFSTARLEPEAFFGAQSELRDLCLCDFDGDGMSDVATTGNDLNSVGVGVVRVFRNTSTLAAASFTSSDFFIGQPTFAITCGDIDGDGKKDLVLTKGGNQGDRAYVLRNRSSGAGSISFAAPVELLTGGTDARKVVVKDLDQDGKPDIIVSDETTNQILVFRNNSTPGVINIAAVEGFAITGATGTNGMAVEDLNNDGFPDIIASSFLNNNFFILTNISVVGDVRMTPSKTIAETGNLVEVLTGDIDDDGKTDVIVNKLLDRTVTIRRNVTTEPGGEILLNTGSSFTTGERPFGMDLGDFNGDGALDIVTANRSSPNEISLMANRSSGSVFNFQRISAPVSELHRFIKVGDINGDAKPDLVYTSTDSDRLGVILNQNCVRPEIEPEATVEICAGLAEFNLEATRAVGVTYQWFRGATALVGETSPTLDVVPYGAGNYAVLVSSTVSTCAVPSTPVAVTVNAALSPDAPTLAATANPVCDAATLEITPTAALTSVAPDSYQWLGPEGFELETSGTLTRPDFNPSMAGRYSVRGVTGSCVGEASEIIVEYGTVPEMQIRLGGESGICSGQPVDLEVSNFADLTYQWYLDDQPIANSDVAVYPATIAGDYYALATSADGCAEQSNTVSLTEIDEPVVSIDGPTSVCVGQTSLFSFSGSVSPDYTPYYQWAAVGVSNSPALTVPEVGLRYDNANTYTVGLTVGYQGLGCENSTSISVEVVGSPVVDILLPDGDSFCPGTTIAASATAGFDSYTWSNGETGAVITVSEAGTLSVEVSSGSGCVGSAATETFALPAPTVTTTATPPTILPGEASQLEATGADTYEWTPTESLTNSLIANPIANPDVTTEYTVTGTAANGCFGEASVTVNIDGSFTGVPRKLFSPNGDSISEVWEIAQIENFAECTVTVYDRQGREVYSGTDYASNPWGGTDANGSELPEGTYFYTITCPDSGTSKTGNVTLVR